MTASISNSADLIDSRDIITRIEELETDRDAFVIGAPDGTETASPDIWALENPDDDNELTALLAFAKDGKDYSPDWSYGATLIRDSYFRDYAQELAEDLCGDQLATATWPMNCIDWDRAERELRVDYTPVEFDGVTYWTR